MKKRILLAVILMIFAICMTAGGFILYGKSQMKKLPGLSFAESIAYTTMDNPDAVISVGIIRDGKASFTVYGENGKELAPELHTYEIGSITGGIITRSVVQTIITILLLLVLCAAAVPPPSTCARSPADGPTFSLRCACVPGMWPPVP